MTYIIPVGILRHAFKAFEFEAGRLVYADAAVIAEIARDISSEVPATAEWLAKLKPAAIGSPSPLPS